MQHAPDHCSRIGKLNKLSVPYAISWGYQMKDLVYFWFASRLTIAASS